jgi:hypothetical protein
MYDYRLQWQALHARIMGLARAAEVFLQAQKVQSEDPYGIAFKVFREQSREILADIARYADTTKDLLPPEARRSLERFLAPDGLSTLIRADGVAGLDIVKGVVPLLVTVAAQTEFLIADREVTSRKLTERAFAHLQRLLVADKDVAAKWLTAYQMGEPACERLGAVHLFSFGIYAFKAHAEGGRTDLVLGEPVDSASPVVAASDALVLTEWKLASDTTDSLVKAAEARTQAKMYQSGLLHGFELQNYRYIVIVGRRVVPELLGGHFITGH